MGCRCVWVAVLGLLLQVLGCCSAFGSYPGTFYQMMLRLNKERKYARTAPSPSRLWAVFNPAATLGSLSNVPLDSNRVVRRDLEAHEAPGSPLHNPSAEELGSLSGGLELASVGSELTGEGLGPSNGGSESTSGRLREASAPTGGGSDGRSAPLSGESIERSVAISGRLERTSELSEYIITGSEPTRGESDKGPESLSEGSSRRLRHTNGGSDPISGGAELIKTGSGGGSEPTSGGSSAGSDGPDHTNGESGEGSELVNEGPESISGESREGSNGGSTYISDEPEPTNGESGAGSEPTRGGLGGGSEPVSGESGGGSEPTSGGLGGGSGGLSGESGGGSDPESAGLGTRSKPASGGLVGELELAGRGSELANGEPGGPSEAVSGASNGRSEPANGGSVGGSEPAGGGSEPAGGESKPVSEGSGGGLESTSGGSELTSKGPEHLSGELEPANGGSSGGSESRSGGSSGESEPTSGGSELLNDSLPLKEAEVRCGGEIMMPSQPPSLTPMQGYTLKQNLSTPGWEKGRYPKEVECVWSLKVGPECEVGLLLYQVLEGEVLQSPRCFRDYLEFVQPNSHATKYCGPLVNNRDKVSGIDSWHSSHARTTTIRFKSTPTSPLADSSFSGAPRGFVMEVTYYCWLYNKEFMAPK